MEATGGIYKTDCKKHNCLGIANRINRLDNLTKLFLLQRN